ncbi:MAG: glycosyl transferase [Clostridia bacterium]|nr:glycosyl transferase [Clostridia bacterium]
MEENLKKNKHAYLILAHNQFDLLKMLCTLLDNPCNDIFIHIDLKVTDFDKNCLSNIKYSNVQYVDRVSVTWGGFSMVKATLNLLKSATKIGGYSYYHLLSGVDLPLRTSKEIYDFFELNSGKEFVHFLNDDYAKTIKQRATLYHFFKEITSRKKGVLYYCNSILLRIQKLLNVNRLKKYGKSFASGSQWFSITDLLARYVVENEAWICKNFSKTFIPDEMFLQILIKGTEFEKKLYLTDSNKGYKMCLRYVDWGRGKPYVFREEDFDDLINSGYLFARKFDMNIDPYICNKIYNFLSETSEKEI